MRITVHYVPAAHDIWMWSEEARIRETYIDILGLSQASLWDLFSDSGLWVIVKICLILTTLARLGR